MTESPAIEKRVATLQAQAALRGIEVDRLFDGTYVVRAYLAQRLIATTDEALVALLARMGVSE